MSDFELKEIGGKQVFFVMAAPMEYGDALKAVIKPLICGIGPVESAVRTTKALSEMPHKPDVILSLGSAGSRSLEQGEVYQASSASYRDIDASLLGFPKGTTPLEDHPVDIPLATPLNLPKARLSTGGAIISGAAYDDIDADMVDMETFALARISHWFDIPLIGLRGISDGKEEISKYGDWADYLVDIDKKLAAVVTDMDDAIAAL